MERIRTAQTIDELREQFQTITARARRLSLTGSDVLARRPSPESWSALECVAHLNLSLDPYFDLWREAISAAPRIRDNTAGEPGTRYNLDLWGRVLVWSLEPPPRFRFPAPPNFRPVETGPPEELLEGFVERQQRMLRVIEGCRGLAIDRVKLVSPFNANAKYSVWSSFCITASHERRHLSQAERAFS